MITAVVPARGGSKGLVGKNLATIGGRSLVRIAVECAFAAEDVEHVVVSSDDPAILAEGEVAGAAVHLRSPHLATDSATTDALIRSLLETKVVTSGIVIVLQPTSPLRRPSDIARCVSVLRLRTSVASVVTVSLSHHPPEWAFGLRADGCLVPSQGWERLPRRRQDCPPTFVLNGAVYATRTSHILNGGHLIDEGTVGVEISPDRAIDIDSQIDLVVARALDQYVGEDDDATPIAGDL